MATDTNDTTRTQERGMGSLPHVPDGDDRPAVTVEVAILTVRERRLEVLLVRRRSPPFDSMWALPGCFVHGDESLEDAARRKG